MLVNKKKYYGAPGARVRRILEWQRVKRRLAEFNGRRPTAAGSAGTGIMRRHSAPINCHSRVASIDGTWRNHESGGAVEATVVGWRVAALI